MKRNWKKKRNPKSSLLYCILSIVKLQDVKNLYMYVNVYEKYYECFRIKSTEFLNEIYMINIYSSFTKFKWYIMIISGTKKKIWVKGYFTAIIIWIKKNIICSSH